jgi:hypothetical protein
MVGYAHGKCRLQRWWMSSYRSKVSDLQKKWKRRTLVIRHIAEHSTFFYKEVLHPRRLGHQPEVLSAGNIIV